MSTTTAVSKHPPYEAPRSGWLSTIPSSWVPYAELMRLDRPNGFWYFYLPHLFGTLHAGANQHLPVTSLLLANLILVPGTLLMRGATCTWNDAVDAPFDRLVPRCRNRPVARGAVSSLAAYIFTSFLSLLSLAMLMALPRYSILYALPAIAGWALYPLAKRVTYYPQVVLGFPMAWGVFMGAVAVGANPFAICQIDNMAEHKTDVSMYALYASNVLWTLFYEIIYSHQDVGDDTKAGVKNIVLLYRGRTKPLLIKLAIGQVLLLAAAGFLAEAGLFYWMCAVFGTAGTSVLIIAKVNLDVPEDCDWWFKYGCCGLTGGVISLGLSGDYVTTMWGP